MRVNFFGIVPPLGKTSAWHPFEETCPQLWGHVPEKKPLSGNPAFHFS